MTVWTTKKILHKISPAGRERQNQPDDEPVKPDFAPDRFHYSRHQPTPPGRASSTSTIGFLFFALRPTLFLAVTGSSAPILVRSKTRSVLCRGYGILIARAEEYIFRQIVADIVRPLS